MLLKNLCMIGVIAVVGCSRTSPPSPLLQWEQKAHSLKVGSTQEEVLAVLPRTPGSPSFRNLTILSYWVDDNTEITAQFGLPGPALSEPIQIRNTPMLRKFSISARSPTSDVAAMANQLVLRAGLKWGEPVEVKWQDGSPPDNSGRWIRTSDEPLNRWLVIYATPDSELGVGGYRGVHVDTNGEAWFVPRL